nr:immunoglobulin heavy chain junction region [Macaca mulatta]
CARAPLIRWVQFDYW